jgi:cell division transport system permease protein
MQMVGATRGFIAKPMNVRALVNGLISSGIAIFILFSLIQWADSQFPQLRTLHNTESTIGLFIGIIIVGVGISIYSTYRSVIKYLKMSLDDLY